MKVVDFLFDFQMKCRALESGRRKIDSLIKHDKYTFDYHHKYAKPVLSAREKDNVCEPPARFILQLRGMRLLSKGGYEENIPEIKSILKDLLAQEILEEKDEQ